VERDDTYSSVDKVLILRDYLSQHKRITSREAARLACTSERHARRLLASMCRVLYMYFDYSSECWHLLDDVDNG
jgi:hypothetical protein